MKNWREGKKIANITIWRYYVSILLFVWYLLVAISYIYIYLTLNETKQKYRVYMYVL